MDIIFDLPKSFIQEMISYILQEYLSKGRLLIDIISDLPKSFIQDDEDTPLGDTVESYAAFLLVLLTQIK